tara:strand:+ start:1661 stop:2365 length:705 start_codon:yes stop_codon:yes gene_type:complete
MQVNIYINARGLKFKDSAGSRPMRMTLSTRDTKDKYLELDVSGMNMEERMKSLQDYAIYSIKKGLIAGGAGKFIDVDKDVVIQDGNIVIKNIAEADVRPDVRINAKGLNPYETGRLIAENKIRGLDSDPSMRKKEYRGKSWENGAVDRIRRWVMDVKLPNSPTEWQFINRLQGEDRERELNKIVNSIIYNKYTGVLVSNKMRAQDIKYEKALNEFADERKYEQTINAARRMNFK